MTRGNLGQRIIAVLPPVMFTWAAVLNLASSLTASPDAVVRPLVVGGLLALAVFGVCLLLSRSSIVATLLPPGSCSSASGRLSPVSQCSCSPCGGSLSCSSPPRRPSGAELGVARFVARATAIFSIALAAVAGWGFASAVAAGEPEWSAPSYGAEGSGGPNVYVVLLDGYPRADTLRDTFGRGNEEFIADLQSRGFDIRTRRAPTTTRHGSLSRACSMAPTLIECLLTAVSPRMPPVRSGGSRE